MERNLLIYLAIENSILLKGFEGLILSQINPQAKLISIVSPQELFNLDFEQDPKWNKVLIYDDVFRSEQNNVLLFNLLREQSDLKAILLSNKLDYKHLKLLFNLGFCGVANKEISTRDFVDLFIDVQNDKKALAPYFQKIVIGHFCQKDKEFLSRSSAQMQEEEISHFEEIYGLTKREKEILCLICNGFNTKEISEELFISLHTAETHRRNILAKLDVKNTAQMVKVAVMHKLVAV